MIRHFITSRDTPHSPAESLCAQWIADGLLAGPVRVALARNEIAVGEKLEALKGRVCRKEAA